ncbi:Acyl-CoA-binding domain-containing protein 2 [Morella rubra]|uniref:Acyl-CoA-binding domain-containing protein 2 n=1 Tax=Morella rubra TaxID=262757 RepID=A0A6A1V1D0_9ROSI|nr:Acyl-CoA-binding domain-containing protein 2 [Morella rubra]
MVDWQQLAQSILLGLIFSFLVAKLISIVISFKEDNLSITRSATTPEIPYDRIGLGSGPPHDTDSVIAEQGSVRNDSVPPSDVENEDEDDDDWEGVESTELDETFSAATAFVAASAADRLSEKVSSDVQLKLYGLYKIATEGPCSTPQPSPLKMTSRAKWQAWQKLGAMPPEEAMQKYIDIVTELYPSWLAGSTLKSRGGEGDALSADTRGPMGPVFSTFVYEEEAGNESKMDAIHAFAREGELDNLLKCIESGVSVNTRDSEGRTPLHWAVDRGHLNIAELLINRSAEVNAKDNDGQTPLHYAVMCEREAIAEYLVKQNADRDLKDNEDSSPSDLCEANWPWMQCAGKQID